MIFVTVGTHEQQFNRLVKAVDELKVNGIVSEDIIIQTGYADYVPQMCEYSQFYPYEQMVNYVKEARIVITHGGPSSFIMPLQEGKIPIVAPRMKEYGEHVNDHQVEFCRYVAEHQGNMLVVEDMDDLPDMVKNYDSLIASMPAEIKSNNAAFCEGLEKIVENLIA